jgi:hypothetical protein
VITSNQTVSPNATGGSGGATGGQGQQQGTTANFSKIREYSMNVNDTLYIRMWNISIGGQADKTRNENDRLTLITKGNFDAAIISVSENRKDEAAYTLMSSADDIDVEIFPLVSANTSKTIIYIINLTKPGYVVLPDTPASKDVESFARSLGPEPVMVKDKDNVTYSSITLQVLNPPAGTFNDALFTDADNNAVAFMLRDRTFKALFCNDMLEGAITMVATKYTSALKTDVLVTPSYGAGGTGEAFNILASYTKPSWGVVEGYKRGVTTGIADPYVYVSTALNGYTRNVTALWDCKQFLIAYDGAKYGTSCANNATSSKNKTTGGTMPTGPTGGSGTPIVPTVPTVPAG